jgi:polysaccharide biosynthesis protein PslG
MVNNYNLTVLKTYNCIIRSTSEISITSVLAFYLFFATSSLAIAACNTTITSSPTSLPATYWGMHISSVALDPWPTDSFGAFRTWDSYPGVSWYDINTASGVYNWVNLDTLVSDVLNKGVDVVYTFGYPPSWATQPSATNLIPWINFVNAIVGRYCSQIKYWELWNEPNAPNFWTGTNADMVAMAKAAYSIIHAAGGVVLSPAPQGAYAYQWLQGYFAAGGNSYTDIVSFHGYLFGAPELIIPLVGNVRGAMSANGLSSNLLWDTEHSWGNSAWPYGDTPQHHSEWLARFIILEASLGVNRSYWYMWDSSEWGTLFNKTDNTISLAGTVYQTIYNWLLGKTVNCSVSGVVYSCVLTPTSSQVVYWTSSGTTTISVNTKYTTTQSIFGNNAKIVKHKITLSETPLLVQ